MRGHGEGLGEVVGRQAPIRSSGEGEGGRVAPPYKRRAQFCVKYVLWYAQLARSPTLEHIRILLEPGSLRGTILNLSDFHRPCVALRCCGRRPRRR